MHPMTLNKWFWLTTKIFQFIVIWLRRISSQIKSIPTTLSYVIDVYPISQKCELISWKKTISRNLVHWKYSYTSKWIWLPIEILYFFRFSNFRPFLGNIMISDIQIFIVNHLSSSKLTLSLLLVYCGLPFVKSFWKLQCSSSSLN